MKKLVSKILIFLAILTSANNISCQKEDPNTAPSAVFIIDPVFGSTETNFTFNASECSDLEDETSQLMIRWDWESDSLWDTQYLSNKIIQYKFNDTATYTITLEVIDTRGLTSTFSQNLVVSGYIPGILVDQRDGKIYKSIKIGEQWWMAENLNYKITDGSWCYDDDISNSDIYGRLYCFPSMIYACPGGWHLPSDLEWQELESFLGMHWSELDNYSIRYTGKVGDKLRSDYGWHLGMNGTNESYFNALPGGHYEDYWVRINNRLYNEIGYCEIGFSTLFFTRTESWNGSYIVRRLYTGKGVERLSWKANERAYIRCVKD